MKKISLILLSLSFCVCFYSCKNNVDNANVDNASFSIRNIDIKNAKMLMVLPASSVTANRSAVQNDTFCKLLENGTVKKVEATDEDGNEHSIIPKNIFDAGDYIIMTLNTSPSVLLVSKETGDAYDLSSIGAPCEMRSDAHFNGLYRKSVYTDSNNNIYYVNGTVKKINVSDINNITVESITPETYYIGECDEFCVDKFGNVLFSKETDFVKSDFIRTLNGSLNLIAVESSGDSFSSFTGYDGYIYYRYVDYEGESDQNYYRVNISPDYTINKSLYGKTGYDSSWSSQGYLWIYLNKKIIVFERKQSNYEQIIYDEETGAPSSITYDFLKNSAFIKASSSYYYVATTDGKVYKINPSTHESSLITSGQFDILNMSVTSDDMIVINGLRYSDGKKILITIDTSEEITVVAENLNNTVTILEKIN